MSKKHVEEVEEEEVAPFWVISFSDMMTLLLAFFIMLFSMSTLEVKKMADVVEAMGNQFGGKGKGTARAGEYLKQMLPVEEKEIPPEQSTDKIRIPVVQEEETLLSGGIILFEKGNEQLNDKTKRGLDLIYRQLEGAPYKVMLRGHASQQEIAGGVYKNTDDLAYTRAWNVREYLVSLGLKPKQLFLAQVGAFMPLKQGSVTLGGGFDDPNAYVEIIQIANAPE